MRIGDFPVVEALVATRNHLIGQRDEGGIAVTINGRRQEADFNEVVAPAIRLEIGRRIEDIDAQLRQYGVRVD